MRRKLTSLVLAACMIIAVSAPAFAGGALETVDLTGNVPSPIPGHIVGRLVGIKWDARTIPVRYSMNTTLDPVPNPLGAPFLSVADAQTALQASFDDWNNLPTSFIDMRITGTTNKVTLAGFDFINELTFRTAAGFTAIASSPSVSLIRDVTLVDGDLIDNDADPDVSGLITTAQDVDGDGDIEFPAGFYKAGTILDNDVQFNTKVSNGLRFTVGNAALDAVTRSVDLNTVATHEFGHSHGLSHSMDNQISATNGGGATMYPFIDTGDPNAELDQKSLSEDDKAWSSFFYPEGTAASGPAALQMGDVAFNAHYGLIRGELRHGVLNQPVAGGSLAAYKFDTGELVVSGYSGTTQVSRAPNGGNFLVDPAFNILNGNYVIPVPRGSYAVGVEAVDGDPVPAPNISLTCQIGSIFGQLNFNEEFYNNNLEAGLELRLGQRKNIPIQAGRTQSGINLTTAVATNINNFGNRNFIGFTGSPAGRIYAVQIPASQVAALDTGSGVNIQAAAFETFVLDASVPVNFARAVLTTGVVNPDNSVTVDLLNPLAVSAGFLGQDGDFAPFYFNEPHDLGKTVIAGINTGAITNLFLVLQIPTTTPFPGVSGQPPLIGLDGGVAVNDVPILGQSFTSDNGGATWARTNTFNFRFSLITSQPLN